MCLPRRSSFYDRSGALEDPLTKTSSTDSPQINHPWINDQGGRMNRTFRDPTVKRLHYGNHDQLRRHLQDFIAACNFGTGLKMLKGLTPCEFICKRWTSQPDRFFINPIHRISGLNT